MTPTPTTDSAVSPVSDERIRQALAGCSEPACVICTALTELLSRRSLDTADGVDDLAAVLWRTELVDAGVPQSAIEGRTRAAFEGESVSTKERWRKFARAALASRTPNTEMVPRPYRELKVWADEVLAAYDERIAKGGMPNAIAGLRSADECLAEPERGDADFLASPPSPAEVTEEPTRYDVEAAFHEGRESMFGTDRHYGERAWENSRSRAALQLNKKG